MAKKLNIDISSETVYTTRSSNEVQDNDAESFTNKLTNVFSECHRILKNECLMIFTYHHSRTEGWTSVYNAISGANFSISQVFPIKSEMSVSIPIVKSKEPINFDLVFVCRKNENYTQNCHVNIENYFCDAINRIESVDLNFSNGDKLIFKYGLALKKLSELGEKYIAEDHIVKIFKELNF